MVKVSSKEHEDRETDRAWKFYKHQISKGWTKQEAINQVESSYNPIIRDNIEKLIY